MCSASGILGWCITVLTSMHAQIADMYRSQAIANQKGNKDED